MPIPPTPPTPSAKNVGQPGTVLGSTDTAPPTLAYPLQSEQKYGPGNLAPSVPPDLPPTSLDILRCTPLGQTNAIDSTAHSASTTPASPALGYVS